MVRVAGQKVALGADLGAGSVCRRRSRAKEAWSGDGAEVGAVLVSEGRLHEARWGRRGSWTAGGSEFVSGEGGGRRQLEG